MKRRFEPKYIRPENVLIGDTIRVNYAEHHGLRVSVQAIVHSRVYQGEDRVYSTLEGAEIFRWNPSHKAPTIILVEPAPAVEPSLFDTLADRLK